MKALARRGWGAGGFGCVMGALALGLAPAAAQELVVRPQITQACELAAAERAEFEACIGLAAAACIDETPGGYSTAGMAGCYDRELAWWDDWLNQVYSERRDQARAADRDKPDYAPSQEQALKAMQRAWIAFRDAKCDHARSQWGGGTGGGPATYACLMDETARQAIYLRLSAMGG